MNNDVSLMFSMLVLVIKVSLASTTYLMSRHEEYVQKRLKELAMCYVAPLYITVVVSKDDDDSTFKTLCSVLGGD